MKKWKVKKWDCGVCDNCGHVDGGELEVITCPTCEKDGCSECMPAGRGCECPECEEGDGEGEDLFDNPDDLDDDDDDEDDDEEMDL